ncbi:restriction endonuclease subunit S [Fibrobacter sp. UWH4]|uniref:restriction endonuclease subunit S n=1 Tax=Fibrobacter sp. UWH4 TaxID=1896210 RepID=UPI0009223227|nr:restriction endonuclease subunit S [Fibrobacter sp. UWH4]SHL55718.1 type I restriction enzyme, S subunit [Fibrobacter sp. UWH4]
MSEWKECTIGELCSNICSGGTPNRSNDSFYNNGNIPWLNTKEVSFNRIYQTENFITELGLKNSAAKWIPQNTVVVAMYGATAGKSAIVKIPVTTNQACCNLTIDGSKADYRFVYYSLFNRYEHLASLANGGAQQNLNAGLIREFKISVPELETQTKIADILSSLDDKIELNNQINRNLEEQAQAIFKNWFIDFEPFGGEMPKDWINGKLGDFVEIKRGGSPRPIQEFLSDSGYRWLKISDVTALNSPFILQIAEHIKESGLNKTVFLKAGSLVLSNSATPGIPKILDLDSCIHDGWLYFPKSKLSNEFLYLFFRDIRKDLVNLGNGSIFTNLKTEILKNFDTALPSNKVLDDFQKIVEPLFKQMLNIQREIQNLSTLRDLLLPKFMTGEINLSC